MCQHQTMEQCATQKMRIISSPSAICTTTPIDGSQDGRIKYPNLASLTTRAHILVIQTVDLMCLQWDGEFQITLLQIGSQKIQAMNSHWVKMHHQDGLATVTLYGKSSSSRFHPGCCHQINDPDHQISNPLCRMKALTIVWTVSRETVNGPGRAFT